MLTTHNLLTLETVSTVQLLNKELTINGYQRSV